MEAAKWIRKAGDNGYAAAQSLLASFYDDASKGNPNTKSAVQGRADPQLNQDHCDIQGQRNSVNHTELVKPNRDVNTRSRSSLGSSDELLPLIFGIPLFITIWYRLKHKTEWTDCIALFMSLFFPLLIVCLIEESKSSARHAGAILVSIPLGYWLWMLLSPKKR